MSATPLIRLEIRERHLGILGWLAALTIWYDPDPFQLVARSEQTGREVVVRGVSDRYEADALLRRAQADLEGLGDDLFVETWGLPVALLLDQK